jgi:hypothetical protein
MPTSSMMTNRMFGLDSEGCGVSSLEQAARKGGRRATQVRAARRTIEATLMQPLIRDTKPNGVSLRNRGSTPIGLIC